MSDAPTTSVFEAQVARVRQISDVFTRVTLAGEQLAGFHPCGPLGPRDLRVKLIFPEPGGRIRVRPEATRGWFPRWRALDPAERGLLRTYTARAIRHGPGATPEVDIDFVMHGHDDESRGPGATWAAGVAEGDDVVLIGPSRAAPHPEGIEWRPPDASAAHPVQVLLTADETAVPAVASILQTLPAGYRGHAILEVPSEAEIQPMPTDSSVETVWLTRGGAPRGGALFDAVRSLPGWSPQAESRQSLPEAAAAPRTEGLMGHLFSRSRKHRPDPARRQALPEVDIDKERLWEVAAPDSESRRRYAWIAGEAATVRRLRSHLVHACGIDRHDMAFMGYWRQGMAEPN
ncbi:MAG TPA: siderophore-interacting protein [Microbacteriaceae bacterium]|nr:siderophore-interacting protein [Microbacteriaceae bacterium]